MYELDFQFAGKMPLGRLHEEILFRTAIHRESFEMAKKQTNGIYNPSAYKVIENQINDFSNSLSVVINLEYAQLKNYNLKLVKNLIKYSDVYGVPLNVYVMGGSTFNRRTGKVSMAFSDADFKKLEELNNTLIEHNKNPLRFNESILETNMAWTLNQVKSANQKIDTIVEDIKSKKMSPFEAMAYIHKIASEFTYKENPIHLHESRSLVGITQTNYIVCVGYATFVKAIIDKLNMKGLECETLNSALLVDTKSLGIDQSLLPPGVGSGGHMQNLIKINDPKYRVKGTYASDACFDSRDEEYPNGKGYANFLFPVTDLLHYKDMIFRQPKTFEELVALIAGVDNEKVDPMSLPVIRKNINHSKPISLQNLKLCLVSVYKKLFPNFDEKYIFSYVDNIIEASIETSKMTFDNGATNAIAIEANKSQMLNQPQK